jgi:signal transduction histidine kinase
VLADCLVLVNHLLARTRITLVRDWAARNPAAMNRQELQQVVINLLVNAIQAMPDGGTLTLQTLDATGVAGEPAVRIRVLDTGAGLAPAVRERLFHPFTTTRGDGTGLGLWISQGLVERYGGRIEADNRDDGVRGACFAVLLLSEAEPPIDPPPN